MARISVTGGETLRRLHLLPAEKAGVQEPLVEKGGEVFVEPDESVEG